MTTVQQTGNKVSQSLLDTMNPKSQAQKTTAEDAQDRFMTLLVTQMQNQDPLNPLDNAQVTSQLAQLSTVTGIDKLNQTITSLQSSYQVSQSMQAASMIGHGVLVSGNTVNLADGKAALGVELTEPVDKLQVTIRDSAGKAIRTMNVDAKDTGVYPMTWDGKTDAGATADNGKYTFEISATRGGEKVSSAKTLAFGEVGSVSTGAQGVKLNVLGVGAATMADVRQIL